MRKEIVTSIIALIISLLSLYINCNYLPTAEEKLECVTNHIKGGL